MMETTHVRFLFTSAYLRLAKACYEFKIVLHFSGSRSQLCFVRIIFSVEKL